MKKMKLTLKLFLVLGLVAVLLIGLINVSSFGKKTVLTSPVQTGDVVDGSGTELVSGKVYPMSSSMTFSSVSTYSATASDGIIVEATVKPSSLANKAVNWSIAWADAESDFAKGKVVSNYLSITPEVDTNKVLVKCLKPFGEKINLTATSQLDPSKSATCVVDYAYRFTGFSWSRVFDWGTDSARAETDFVDSDRTLTWDRHLLSSDQLNSYVLPVYSDVGTVEPSEVYMTVRRDIGYYNFNKIIENYIDSLTEFAGKKVGDEISLDSDLYFSESDYYYDGRRWVFDGGFSGDRYFENLGFWTGRILENIYIYGNDSNGAYHFEEITKHPELIDLLLEEIIRVGPSTVPLYTLTFSYEDAFETFDCSVKIYLSGEALEFLSVELDLDNSNIVV